MTGSATASAASSASNKACAELIVDDDDDDEDREGDASESKRAEAEHFADVEVFPPLGRGTTAPIAIPDSGLEYKGRDPTQSSNSNSNSKNLLS